VRRLWTALAAAVLVFLACGFLLHHGFYRRSEISDLPEYRAVGHAIDAGRRPYADIAVEYPPGALPAFVLPEVLPRGGRHDGDSGYRYVFERLMWACGVAVLVGMALTLRALKRSDVRSAAVLGFAAIAPLALGTIYLLRFDLWPAAIVALALAALVGGRLVTGSALLGLGAAVKIYPAVFIPLVAIYAWRRFGKGVAARCIAAFVVALAAVVVPFLVLSPHGIWASIERQHGRPLQIESLGGAFFLVAHHAAGLAVAVTKSAGSENVSADGTHAIASLQDVLQLVALLVLWVAFARGPATRERLVRYVAATATAYVAFGKVLSPQYLIWLVPLVPLMYGRRGTIASGVLALALVATQVWFPFRYYDLRDLHDAFAAWLVLARDVWLLVLLAVLLVPLSRAGPPSVPTAP
jgi:Glycosyltransferase family 87